MNNNLTKYREAKNLSMRQLARLSGMSAMQISRLESGENQFTHKTLLKLSKSLNINPEDLITASNKNSIDNLDKIIDMNCYDNSSIVSNSYKDYTTIKILQSTLNDLNIYDINNIVAFKVKEYQIGYTIKLNDTLFLDNSITSITSDTGMYIFLYDDILYIKRINKIPNSLLIISEQNNEKYDTWEISLPCSNMKILGKVIAKISYDIF